MKEKQPKQPAAEEILKSLGKYAVRPEQIISPEPSITSGIEISSDGKINFVSNSRYIRRSGMTRLSKGRFNPNHN